MHIFEESFFRHVQSIQLITCFVAQLQEHYRLLQSRALSSQKCTHIATQELIPDDMSTNNKQEEPVVVFPLICTEQTSASCFYILVCFFAPAQFPVCV